MLKEGFEYLLQYVNLGYLKKFGLAVPRELEGKVDEDLLKKTQAYEAEKTRFGFLSSGFSNILILVFIFGGLLNKYDAWIVSLNLSFIMSGLLFFLLLSYINTFISIPFGLYSTFKIERKYGFNTMTGRLWLVDFLKSLGLSTVLTSFLVSAGLWLVQSSPEHWWIWVWCFFLFFSLFVMYVSPYVIEPLFNKFTPVGEEKLEEGIRAILQKVGITVKRVFKMDASKRSRHTNAYFSGIGRVKRIILYDTLIEKMSHDEILAVLAHEAGHWKKKHVLKMIVAVEIISFVALYLSFVILRTDFLASLFRIRNATFFARLVVLAFIGDIISFPFTPLASYISRRFERESDRFACGLTENPEAMANALIELSKDNLSNLHPHPVYAAFYYSHPPVMQRIRNIRKSE